MRGTTEGSPPRPLRALLVVVGFLVALAGASPAQAGFEQIKIREFKAADVLEDDDFVELQMFSPGQGEVGDHYLRIYNAMGSSFQTFTFLTDVANQENQRTILVGDSDVLPRDFTWDVSLPVSGGALCYLESLGPPGLADVGIDCVSWGNFDGTFSDGTPSPVGSNAPALTVGSSLERSIARGCPTLLEAQDDTNNSAADFALRANPSPRVNSAAPTEHPCGGGGGGPGPGPTVKCGGLTATQRGTAGPNLLRGTPKRDVIAGLAGADRIRALAGNDLLCGGKGRDRLLGGRGRDRLLGQAGRDICRGGPGRDRARRCEVKRTI